MSGNREDSGSTAKLRAGAALIALIAGVSVLWLLTWVIVYHPVHRPWILNRSYPPVPVDLLARFWQADAARTGTNIYVPYGQEGFFYPPGAIILFWPITYMPFLRSFAVWTQVSVWSMAATYLVALRATMKGPWLEHIAIAIWACAVTVILFPPMESLLSVGQTSTILLLLVILDLLIVRDRAQGVLVGVATAFKLYPGVVIFFWLWRKQWRPAITAALTFIVVTVVAWGVWPQISPWNYLKFAFGGIGTHVLESPVDRIWNASTTALFLRLPLLSDSAALALGSLACLGVALVGVWIAVRLYRQGYRVTTLVILVCTSVLITPVAWDHYFTFAPLLVFVIIEVGFSTAAGKLAVLSLGCFSFPWVAFHVVNPQTNLDGGNALFIAALSVMVSGFLAARVPRGDRTTDGVPESWAMN